MPRLTDAEQLVVRSLSSEDDDRVNIAASIPATQSKTDEQAEEQLEQELVETAEQEMPAKKTKTTNARKSKKSQNAKVEKAPESEPEPEIAPEDSINGAASDEEDVYEVESIVDHAFKGKKCLYKVRWKGWAEEDDTWEPEDHLLPQSTKILGDYHSKIGGAPQPPKQTRKQASKVNLKASPTRHLEPNDTETAPQSSKRAKRTHEPRAQPGSVEWQAEEYSAWQPSTTGSWEDLVHEVETVERDDNGQLYAYIRFRNGKRSKVAQSLYHTRCPRALVRFYENHLNFQ